MEVGYPFSGVETFCPVKKVELELLFSGNKKRENGKR